VDDQAVRDRLVVAARDRQLIVYLDLAKLMGIDTDNPHFAAQVGKVLDRLNQDEVANGRPMLSAIVVSKDTMLPGRGFFNLGEQLRLTVPGEDEVAFAVRQIQLVHDYWSAQTEDVRGPSERSRPKGGFGHAFRPTRLLSSGVRWPCRIP
jgi:hypothetical protein